MAYVYRHIRLDKNEPFYIGIGNNKSRAYTISKRNNRWKNIVNKHGYKVEITHSDLIWEDACLIEKYLISFYGRLDINTGILCNMTDGGEGALNRIFTKEHRDRISLSKKGQKQTQETIQKIRISKKGFEHTDLFKKNMSLRFSGENNPNFGKKTPEHIKEMKRKIILDYNTGIFYESLLEASNVFKIKNGNLSKMLNGVRRNYTNLKYV
jgi:hypothetical protein